MATVLLLDDSEANLPSLRSALELAGHRVVAGESGIKGLEIIRSLCPHVIVTDWQMPGMDGVEFCKELRKRVVFRRVPIILLSGEREPSLQRPVWTKFFRKPVPLAELINAVESFSRRSRFLPPAEAIGELPASRWAAVRPALWP
ncbi:response regulator receiver protein [Burkholderia sp. SJ98]|nr:response regulator receiver protein [Burkholderia sp. SJ98]